MLSREQSELLTRTGPETPGGALLRRYWQPVALASELPPGGAPLPVQLLGEDLVLFRDDQERIGLLDRYCSHRGIDLSYGRLEHGGLRCLYHGWLYDVRGRCLEQPAEPADSTFKDKIRHPAYPCQETGDLIFAYLGPGDPPLLPAYEFFSAPNDCRYVRKAWQECNYLQGLEGAYDPAHLPFLHRFLTGDAPGASQVAGVSETPNTLLAQDLAPRIELEETAFGLRIYTIRQSGPDQQYVRLQYYILPNVSAFPQGAVADGYAYAWNVPADDTHHWVYQISVSRGAPVDRDRLDRMNAQVLTADSRLKYGPANRYGQDREEMRAHTYSGMGRNFLVQDTFAVESPGPIQNRAKERLGTSDKAIIAARRLLLDAVEAVQAGREPPHVVRSADANCFTDIVVLSKIVSAREDARALWQQAAKSV